MRAAQRIKEKEMNLPNKLTISRIFMVPVFAVFAARAAQTHGAGMYLAAGLVFAL